jgi:hypothetical protein
MKILHQRVTELFWVNLVFVIPCLAVTNCEWMLHVFGVFPILRHNIGIRLKELSTTPLAQTLTAELGLGISQTRSRNEWT